MRHGRLIVVLLAVFAALLLAGCGGRQASTTTVSAPLAGAPSTTGTPATEPGAEPGTEQPATTEPPATTERPPDEEEPPATTEPPSGGAEPQAVRRMVAEMTLQAKAAQVLLVTFDGTTPDDFTRQILSPAAPAGVLLLKRNVTGEEQVRSLTAALQTEAEAAGSPGLFVAADEEGGPVMRIKEGVPEVPAAREVAAGSSPEEAGALALETGAALLGQGVNMVLAPVADVVADKGSFLYQRSYGSRPGPVTDFVAAVTAGFGRAGMVTVVKHFPGHGSASGDSHTASLVSDVSRAQFETVHLPPFRAAVEAGADGVMVAHFVASAYDSEHPASQSAAVIEGVLRKDLGFTGLAVTDDLEMAAASGRSGQVGAGDVAELGRSAVAALNAGSDLLITTSTLPRQTAIRQAIEDAVRSGDLDEARLDEAVGRVLMVKLRHSLLQTGL